jgi:F-type H+/Na+-transporting ATPase subunit alpha
VFAGTRGFLDKLKVEAVLPFERFLHEYLKTYHGAVLEAIVSTGNLEGAMEQKLTTGCQAALDGFLRESPEAALAQ